MKALFKANRTNLCIWACYSLLLGNAMAAQAPVLFFSDLTSGPNTGGEGNNGAYVTVYGNFLGSGQGSSTITAGGGAMVNCKQWGTPWLNLPSGQNWIEKITCQLGPSAATGNIVITVNGQASNGLPFTVRPGNIYFVSTSGNDSNNGSFASPWKSIPHAVQTAGASAGSTIYAMNGVSATSDDGQGWDASLTLRAEWCKGSSSAPAALLAYPGASVTIGSSGNSPSNGIRGTDFTSGGGACTGNWVFGGLNLRGAATASINGPSDNWRFIGNDISNPQANGGGGGSAAWESSQATHAVVLGNNAHDLNLASTDRLQQGIYFSTDSNHAELGWNLIHNAKGRAGVQTHSSPISSGNGYIMYDISIHDNIIYDIAEECIIVDTVDPSQGPVSVYNNVVFNCGQDGNSNGSIYRAVSSDFDTGHGVGSGTIDFYNNTFAGNFVGAGFSDSFEVHNGQRVVDRVRNNLILAPNSVPYWSPTNSSNDGGCSSSDTAGSCPNFAGSNNLVYGSGGATFTNILTNSINANPNFVNGSGFDFHLSPGSPGIGAGTSIASLTRDIEGNIRPANSPSAGAFEVAGVASQGTALSSLSCNPMSLVTPATATCSVGLTAPAPAAGFQVSISTDSKSVAVPASVTVPANSSTAQFTVNAASVGAATTANVTASSAGNSPSVALTLNPPVAVTSVNCSPASISGAGSATCTVNLSSAAPASGATVTLSDNSGSLTTPASVPVASGKTSASFNVTAAAVTSTASVAITASYGGASASFNETLVPLAVVALGSVNCSPNSIVTPGSTMCMVTLTASAQTGGFPMSISNNNAALSTPSSLTIPAGQMSGTFAASAATVNASSAAMVTVTGGPSSMSATTMLMPPSSSAVGISVTPGSISLAAGQSQAFKAAVTGSTNTAVTWSLNPQMGSVSSTGVYTAPASIASAAIVTLTATSAADKTKSSSASISLNPTVAGGSQYTVSFKQVGSQLQVNWTAPAGRHSGDYITLSSPGAPNWWSIVNHSTNGAASGSFTVAAPTQTGVYEFRYGVNNSYKIAARSAPYNVNVSQFSLTVASTQAQAGGQISFSFTAPAGRPGGYDGDSFVLYKAGTGSDYPVSIAYPLGATQGTLTMTAPASGTYVIQYLLANGYLAAAMPVQITVQ